MALAVDLHAQGQIKPGALAVITARKVVGMAASTVLATLRGHADLQRIRAGDPVGQAGRQADLKSGLAQRREIIFGPAQPPVLVVLHGQAEIALRIAAQTHVVQCQSRLGFGGQIAVQHDTLGRIYGRWGGICRFVQQHRGLHGRREKCQAVIVKTQAGAEQAELGHVTQRHPRNLQARGGHDALQHRRGFEHGRQRQARQAPQQRGFMQREGGLRNWRGFEQQGQMVGDQAGHFNRATFGTGGVKVQRWLVGKPLGLRGVGGRGGLGSNVVFACGGDAAIGSRLTQLRV